MDLKNITIILVQPLNPGNIGSVSRAMRNTGLDRLRLIQPCDFRGDETRKMAVGDMSILTKARVCENLRDALKGVHLAVATTRRSRRRFSGFLSPRELAAQLAALPARSKAAIVFGPEDKGLSNSDIALCQRVSTIPAHGRFPSYNLAQAVMIYAYEIFCAFQDTVHARRLPGAGRRGDLATVRELEGMYGHWEQVLGLIKFFNRGRPQTLMESIRGFMGRSALSSRDIRILRGMFAAIELKFRAGKP